MSGQELLETLEPISFDGGAKSKEWLSKLELAFNTYSKLMVPEGWAKKKNRNWWQRFAMSFILLLAKDSDTWDNRKRISAEACAAVVRSVNLNEYYRERYGNHFYELAEKFGSFESFVKSYVEDVHSTIKQQMAAVFLEFMFQTDKRFFREIVSLRKDGILADTEKFSFPMI